MNKLTSSPLSYQVDVSITPNWRQIVRWYFPELKTDKKASEFMGGLRKKFKVDEDVSLYLKTFSFVEFYDGVSGLNPIWSCNRQGFSSDLEVGGWLLTDGKGKFDEGNLDDVLISKNKDGEDRSVILTISPQGIRTEDGETISEIPYGDIINLFVQIQMETRCASYWIKKFPEAFQDVFDRDKISYTPDFSIYSDRQPKKLVESKSKWAEESGVELYSEIVDGHIFETPYYSVSFKLKFFEPGDPRPYTSDLSAMS